MDGEEEEPVTPAGRFFLQPDVEAIINCVIGLKLPIDIEVIKAEICKTLLNHPRFCSILVRSAIILVHTNKKKTIPQNSYLMVFNQTGKRQQRGGMLEENPGRHRSPHDLPTPIPIRFNRE